MQPISPSAEAFQQALGQLLEFHFHAAAIVAGEDADVLDRLRQLRDQMAPGSLSGPAAPAGGNSGPLRWSASERETIEILADSEGTGNVQANVQISRWRGQATSPSCYLGTIGGITMVEKTERTPPPPEPSWSWWMEDGDLFPLWSQLQDPYAASDDYPPSVLPGLGINLPHALRRLAEFLGFAGSSK